LVNATFQDLFGHDSLRNTFCFVVSSLAIHHLVMEEKAPLFEHIHGHLDPGGFFLNIDVVLSPTGNLESWYLTLWREWIDLHTVGSEDDFPSGENAMLTLFISFPPILPVNPVRPRVRTRRAAVFPIPPSVSKAAGCFRLSLYRNPGVQSWR
jgi:hypothetical protein